MCTWLWQSFAVERLASCPRSVGSSLERPNARARKKFGHCQLCQSLKKVISFIYHKGLDNTLSALLFLCSTSYFVIYNKSV